MSAPIVLETEAGACRIDSSICRSLVRLPIRHPFNWAQILGWFRPRAIPGVERVGVDTYRRTISIDGLAGIIETAPSACGGFLDTGVWLAKPGLLASIEPRLRNLYDLDVDVGPIETHLRGDPFLAPLIDAASGLRIPGTWHPFELAIRAVLGQQITVAGATSLTESLVLRYGTRLPPQLCPSGLKFLFPTATDMAGLQSVDLRMPRARAGSLAALAAAFRDRPGFLDDHTSLDQLVDELCCLQGVGPWTAQYIAMRAYHHADAFPASDIGLRKAAATGSDMPSAKELLVKADAWRPWRAYAAMHLWHSLAGRQAVKRVPAATDRQHREP